MIKEFVSDDKRYPVPITSLAALQVLLPIITKISCRPERSTVKIRCLVKPANAG